MIRRRSIVALVILPALCLSLVRPAAAEELPSLLGTWYAKYQVQTRHGSSPGETELEITEQNGPLFRGTYKWKYDPNTPVVSDHASGVGKQGEEKFLGVIGWENRSIYIADVGDRGHSTGQLTDANTMKIVYVESGDNATVARIIFVRRPSSKSVQ